MNVKQLELTRIDKFSEDGPRFRLQRDGYLFRLDEAKSIYINTGMIAVSYLWEGFVLSGDTEFVLTSIDEANRNATKSITLKELPSYEKVFKMIFKSVLNSIPTLGNFGVGDNIIAYFAKSQDSHDERLKESIIIKGSDADDTFSRNRDMLENLLHNIGYFRYLYVQRTKEDNYSYIMGSFQHVATEQGRMLYNELIEEAFKIELQGRPLKKVHASRNSNPLWEEVVKQSRNGYPGWLQ